MQKKRSAFMSSFFPLFLLVALLSCMTSRPVQAVVKTNRNARVSSFSDQPGKTKPKKSPGQKKKKGKSKPQAKKKSKKSKSKR